MSSWYRVRSEVFVNDKWVSLNRPILGKETVTYESGSSSCFGDTYDALLSMGKIVKDTEVSDELRRDWQQIFDNTKDYMGVYAVDIESIRNKVKNTDRKTNCAYVEKQIIRLFESGELDEIYQYLNVEEYKKLKKDERVAYEWYEWDDKSSVEYNLREILKHHEWLMFEYMCTDFFDDVPRSRIVFNRC